MEGGCTMKKITTSDRLKSIMNSRNLKQVDILNLAKPFCEKYGVRLGKNDLSQYVHGKAEPRQEKLTVLGMALGVSEAWLMGFDVPESRMQINYPSNLDPLGEMEKTPLLGTIACGTPILAVENIEEYVDLPRHIRADFALTCRGDSMIGAGIEDGDIVYIKKQPKVEHGQIAAVLIEDEATLKRFYQDSDHVYLQSENPKYSPLVYVGEDINQIRIIGLAVAHTRRLV